MVDPCPTTGRWCRNRFETTMHCAGTCLPGTSVCSIRDAISGVATELGSSRGSCVNQLSSARAQAVEGFSEPGRMMTRTFTEARGRTRPCEPDGHRNGIPRSDRSRRAGAAAPRSAPADGLRLVPDGVGAETPSHLDTLFVFNEMQSERRDSAGKQRAGLSRRFRDLSIPDSRRTIGIIVQVCLAIKKNFSKISPGSLAR